MDVDESFPDAKISPTASNTNNNNNNNNGLVTNVDPDELYYNMSGEKYLLIFNHLTFQKTPEFRNVRPCSRSGTEEDVNILKRVFHKMGYKVLVYNNFIYDDIMKTVKNISSQDHSSTACLCIAILTHGDKNEELYANDIPYSLRDITSKLERGHPTLVGKPKLFFIQACRGDNLDAGRTVQTDGPGGMMVLPSSADFFFLRSSVEGFLSYRNINGSFLIQEFSKAVETHYEEKDIHYITTLVNRNVAFYYSTYTPGNKSTNNKKQMPEVRHTLTKLYKF